VRRALALALVLAVPCAAQDVPLDAPVAAVKKGDVVAFDGLLLSDTQAIAQARRVAGCEAKAAVLEKNLTPSTPWWVIPVVAVLAVGAGVGLGVAVAR
jgi:hypothetical protein